MITYVGMAHLPPDLGPPPDVETTLQLPDQHLLLRQRTLNSLFVDARKQRHSSTLSGLPTQVAVFWHAKWLGCAAVAY